jgi:thioredoxin-related protein
VGNALAILILLIYFWFACDWPYEHPSPVFYQLNDIMVTVADASPPTGGGGKIHWEVGQYYILFTPEAARKMNVRQFEGSTHGPVMIMCTRDSCERCDRMEKETLSNPAISEWV